MKVLGFVCALREVEATTSLSRLRGGASVLLLIQIAAAPGAWAAEPEPVKAESQPLRQPGDTPAGSGEPPPAADAPPNSEDTWFDPPPPPPTPPPPPEAPAPSAEPARHAPPLECRPACPSGSTCSAGTCVSACNPPCAEGEACSSAGACVRPRAPSPVPVNPPPPLSPPRKGDYLHDGFYARLTVGPTYSWATGQAAPNLGPVIDYEFELEGAGASLGLFLGGTLPNGVAIGVVLAGAGADEPTYDTLNGDRRGGSLSHSLLGLFADWYFDPRKGLHLLAAAGLASVSLDGDQSIPLETLRANGLSLLLGGGYDWFVGRDVSMGPLLSLMYTRTRFQENEPYGRGDFSTYAASLSFAMTYN